MLDGITVTLWLKKGFSPLIVHGLVQVTLLPQFGDDMGQNVTVAVVLGGPAGCSQTTVAFRVKSALNFLE